MNNMTLPPSLALNTGGSLESTMRACRSDRSAPRRERRGFSLIELVIGSAIALVVMLAAGGTLHLMTRGGASLQASAQLATDASVAMTRLRRELGAAVTIASLSASSITFTHPDLNGDGADDVIWYSWSGQPGSPLQRQVGAGEAVSLVDNVTQFTLSYETNQVTTPGEAADMTNEVILASHQGCPSESSCTFGSSPGVTTSVWRGEVFSATTNDAQSFTVTRLKVYIQRVGSSGTLYASIRSSGGGTVYQEVSTAVNLIPTGGYVWQEFTFPSGPSLDPGNNYSFLLRANTSSATVYVGRDLYNGTSPSDGTWYLGTDNGGGNYTTYNQYDAWFILYGRFKLNHPQFNPDVIRTYLKSFDIRLKLSDGQRSIDLRSGAACGNRPEITGVN